MSYLDRSLLLFAISAFALNGLACNGDPASTDNGQDDRDTGIHDEDAGDQDGDADDGPDANDDEDASNGGGEDAGGDTGVGPDPLEPPEPSLWIDVDNLWVEHALLDGSTSVGCDYRDGWGRLLDQPDDLVIDVEGYSDVVDGRYAFDEAGAYQVSCSSESLGMETTTEIVVAFEGVHHAFTEAMQRIGRLEALWLDFFAHIDADEPDLDALDEVVDALEAKVEGLSDALEGLDLMVDHPAGWPEIEAIEAAGFESEADDQAWIDAIDGLLGEHDAYRLALAELTLDMEEDELDALEIPLANIHDGIAELSALDPGPLAVWTEQDRLAELLFETAKTAEFQVEVFVAMAREEPVSMINASIVGQLGVAAIKVAWNRFGFSPMGWYKGKLKDVGRSAAISAMQMTIAGVFNSLINPIDGAPHISSIHGSAGGFVCSGVPFTAVGAFQTPPGRNRFLFLPPSSLYPIFEIYDAMSQLNSLADSLASAITNLDIVSEIMFYNELEKTLTTIRSLEGPGSFLVEMTPYDGDGDFLYFEALPPGMNDSFVPEGGTFFPVDAQYGFGEAHNVNVVQGECG
jgi:hypothetical protein